MAQCALTIVHLLSVEPFYSQLCQATYYLLQTEVWEGNNLLQVWTNGQVWAMPCPNKHESLVWDAYGSFWGLLNLQFAPSTLLVVGDAIVSAIVYFFMYGYTRSQVNITWNNAPHHHVTFFPPNCGITNYIFVTACHDKFTCHEKKIILFYFKLSTKKI
jgi:hypothetical protein